MDVSDFNEILSSSTYGNEDDDSVNDPDYSPEFLKSVQFEASDVSIYQVVSIEKYT